VSVGQICAGYLGLLSLGAAALALGSLASALTRSQVVAGILGGALVVALILMWMLARVSEAPFASIFEYLSFWDRHFRPFMTGHVETESLVYYASVTVLGLFGTTQVLAWRRRR
jgi:ABC-2 type transport system permease protein